MIMVTVVDRIFGSVVILIITLLKNVYIQKNYHILNVIKRRRKLHVQQYSLCLLFIDSSSIYLIRQLCKDYGVNDCTQYEEKTKDQLLLTQYCGGENLIHSVSFRTKRKLMLEQLHKVVSTHQLRIDPKFKDIQLHLEQQLLSNSARYSTQTRKKPVQTTYWTHYA